MSEKEIKALYSAIFAGQVNTEILKGVYGDSSPRLQESTMKDSVKLGEAMDIVIKVMANSGVHF